MTKDLTKSQLIPTNRATVYNKYICYLLGMFLLKSHNQHTCYILFVFCLFFFSFKKTFWFYWFKVNKKKWKKEIFFWFLQTFLLLGLHSSVNVKNIVYSSDNLCFLTFHGETKYNTINSHALEHWVEKAKYGYWKNSVVYLISLPTIKAYQVKKKIKNK